MRSRSPAPGHAAVVIGAVCAMAAGAVAGCTGGDDEPPKPVRPALPADQTDPCKLVSIVDIAALASAENLQVRRAVRAGQPTTCGFDGTRGGKPLTGTVTVVAANALQAPAGATDIPGVGTGARSGFGGTVAIAQVWLGEVGAEVKLDGAGVSAPAPAALRTVLEAVAKRLTGEESRLTDTGPYVGFGNPACALLADGDVAAYYGTAPHAPASGSRVDGQYHCNWFTEGPRAGTDTLSTRLGPPGVTPEAFDKQRPSRLPRLAGIGDAAYVTVGEPLTGTHITVLHGDVQFTISAGLKAVPYAGWKAARAKVGDLARRAVGHLPKSPRPAASPTTAAPRGPGRWCCADGSTASGPQPPPAGHARYTGDGFTVAFPKPYGHNELAHRGTVRVKLFGPARLDAVLAIDDAGGAVTDDPAALRKDAELIITTQPTYGNYRRIGLTPLTYRGGRAVDWEGTYVTGRAVTMHFRTRLFILPDGRQWMIHANARQRDFGRTLPYFEAALRTFDPLPGEG